MTARASGLAAQRFAERHACLRQHVTQQHALVGRLDAGAIRGHDRLPLETLQRHRNLAPIKTDDRDRGLSRCVRRCGQCADGGQQSHLRDFAHHVKNRLEPSAKIPSNHTKLSTHACLRFSPCRLTKHVQRLCAGLTVLAAFSTPVAAQPPGLVVSVAASVYDALDEIAGLYRAATGVTVALNAGGSNTLARQIVEGAKAGLFLSADEVADGCRRESRPHRRRHAHAAADQRARRRRPANRRRTSRWRACSRAASRGWRWASRARFPPASTGARGSSTRGAGRASNRRSCRFRRCARCCRRLSRTASMPASSIAPTR